MYVLITVGVQHKHNGLRWDSDTALTSHDPVTSPLINTEDYNTNTVTPDSFPSGFYSVADSECNLWAGPRNIWMGLGFFKA